MSRDTLPFKLGLFDQDQATWNRFNSNSSNNSINILEETDSKTYFPKMEKTNNPELVDIQIKLLESNIGHLKLHLETLESLGDDENLAKLETTRESIAKLESEKQDLKGQLSNSEEIKDIFKNNLDIPKFEDEDKEMDWTMIYSILKSGITGADQNKFITAWNTIKTLARNHKYSENNVDSLWRYALEGEAKFYYESKKGLNFKERLRLLLNLYSPTFTIRNKLAQLKNLKRTKDQSISQFMSRLDFLLEETSITVAPELREARRIHLLEENLMRACSRSAKQKILHEETQHFQMGLFLKFEDKLDIAIRQESMLNDFPEEEIAVHLDEGGEDTYNKIGQLFHTMAEEEEYDNRWTQNNAPNEAESYSVSHQRGRQPYRNEISDGRSTRREEADKRRSASRELNFNERRRVNFADQWTDKHKTNLDQTEQQPTIFQRKAIPRGAQVMGINTESSEEKSTDKYQEMIYEQQKILQEIKAEMEKLKSNSRPRQQTDMKVNEELKYRQNGGRQGRDSASPSHTYEMGGPNYFENEQNYYLTPQFQIPNLWPKDFQIKINNPPRRTASYQNRSHQEYFGNHQFQREPRREVNQRGQPRYNGNKGNGRTPTQEEMRTGTRAPWKNKAGFDQYERQEQDFHYRNQNRWNERYPRERILGNQIHKRNVYDARKAFDSKNQIQNLKEQNNFDMICRTCKRGPEANHQNCILKGKRSETIVEVNEQNVEKN